VRGVVIDALVGDSHVARLPEGRTGVETAVIGGERAGGELDADAMARAEDPRRAPAVYLAADDGARLDERPAVHAVGATRPRHGVSEALSESGRVDVQQLDHEIGVWRRGGGVELGADRSSHLGIGRQRLRHEDQYVVTSLDGGVVIGATDL
jgi:hypothetical protein